MRPLRRTAAERAAAWIVTGPLGHLYGGVADWVVLLVRLQAGRWRARRRRR